MTALKEINSVEFDNRENKFVIYFFKEGDWYHAYQWSAYLAYMVTNKHNVPLKPIKKSYKEGEIVSVGLMLSSFKKYFDKNGDEDEFVLLENKLMLDVSKELGEEKYEDSDKIFKEWVDSIELSRKKKNNKTAISNSISVDGYGDYSEIIAAIREYPLATKTLVDNTVFLGHIQSMLQNKR